MHMECRPVCGVRNTQRTPVRGDTLLRAVSLCVTCPRPGLRNATTEVSISSSKHDVHVLHSRKPGLVAHLLARLCAS